MRPIAGVALGVVMAVAAGLPADDKAEKIDANKLLGKWEPKMTKTGSQVTVEFAKGGKLTITAFPNGKEFKLEGTYKLDGNKLTVAAKKGGKEDTETMTVLKLTDAELVTKDSRGKEETLTRIKAKQ